MREDGMDTYLIALKRITGLEKVKGSDIQDLIDRLEEDDEC